MVTKPLDTEKTKPKEPEKVEMYKPTDDEIGDKFIAESNNQYRYFFGFWHQYSEGTWLPLQQGIDRLLWEMLKGMKGNGVKPSAYKVSAVEKYLQQYLFVSEDCIDNHPDYINLQNGLFNLKTEQLEQHKPEMYMTSQLPFPYDPDAACPNFHKFLNESLVDKKLNPDGDLRMLVLEALGYSLTSNTDFRTSFWLLGESGSGKSVLISVLTALAGNSHVAIDLDELNNTTYQMADVAGKRVVTFTEPRANSVLADNHYKRLVSQDYITARQIHGKPFRFRPICKVWGAMNELPRVVDRSDAIFNRVKIIPFNYVVPEHKKDVRLVEKLESELSGIFNLAIVGLKRLRNAKKFEYSQQSEDARQSYKAENDIEAAFIADWCERDDTAVISGQVLYDAYNAWCKRNGAMPKSSIKVARDWERLGFQRKRSNGTWYAGIKLNTIGSSHVSQ